MVSRLRCLRPDPTQPLDAGIFIEHPRQQACLLRVTEAEAEKGWT